MMWIRRHDYLMSPDGGGSGGGGGTGGTGGTGGSGGGTGGGEPWHQGMDAALLGHAQNKGWNMADAKSAFLAAAGAHQGAERMIGTPADRLLKLPERSDDQAGWKAVWQRLGVPAEAKDYDFSGIKTAAGEPFQGKLADLLRSELHARNVPKDAAAEIAKAIVKHNDGEAADARTLREGTLSDQTAALEQSWGKAGTPKYNENLLAAQAGAQRLGLSAENVAELEKTIGYDKVMEAMRRVGAMGQEGRFHEGGGPRQPPTRDAAIARKAELMADQAWRTRLLANDAQTVREWRALENQIAGEAA